MSTTIRHLLNEAERKGFFGRTWDKIKSILATGVALGGLHWGATKLFPKYASLSRGVTDKYIKGPMVSGAAAISGDLKGEASAILAQINALTGVEGAEDKLKSLQNQYDALQAKGKTYQEINEATSQIKRFIKQLGEKNYSVADKYLQRVVEDKLKAKIAVQYNKQRLY